MKHDERTATIDNEAHPLDGQRPAAQNHDTMAESKRWRLGMLTNLESQLAALGFEPSTYIMANILLTELGLPRKVMIHLDEDGFLRVTTNYGIAELGVGNDMADVTQMLATLNRESRVCEFFLSSPTTVTADADIDPDGDEDDLRDVMERWEYDTNELWKKLTH